MLLHDQDTLNVVVKYFSFPLHPKYNVQPRFYCGDNLKRIYIPESELGMIQEAVTAPVILHYSVGIKPWYKDSEHPLQSEWLKYLKYTKWKNMKIGYMYPLYKRILWNLKYNIKK